MIASTLAERPIVEVDVQGQLDLAACAAYLEVSAGTGSGTAPGAVRLAFPVEGSGEHVGVVVRQRAPNVVEVEASEGTDSAAMPAAVAHVRRILSLDIDDSGLADVERADPVVQRLRERHPGLRPVLFHTPYEAACWAILCHGVRVTRGTELMRRIAGRFGRRMPVDGRTLFSFPGPDELQDVLGELAGVSAEKVRRLASVAEAASHGLLDAAPLRAMAAEEGMRRVQELPGIGPFSASLIVVRGAGHPDALPSAEPWLYPEMAQRYGVSDGADAERIADRWRPYRSWVAFLLRVSRELLATRIPVARSPDQA